jgi:hypothetical protein
MGPAHVVMAPVPALLAVEDLTVFAAHQDPFSLAGALGVLALAASDFEQAFRGPPGAKSVHVKTRLIQLKLLVGP